jgi:hypothetical protein
MSARQHKNATARGKSAYASSASEELLNQIESASATM